MCGLWPCNGWKHWGYYRDLPVLFCPGGLQCSLSIYLDHFFTSLDPAPRIAQTFLASVKYCRTRGPTGFLFLIVHLFHMRDPSRPILLKLQGFDGPLSIPNPFPTCSSLEEASSFNLGGIAETERQVVGTRHYDAYHTISFPMPDAPTIVDFLTATELATQRDHTRAGYPPTLFLALKALFNGVMTSSTKRRARAAPLSSLDVAEDAKNAVVDAFPAGRARMQEEMNRHLRAPISISRYDKLASQLSATSRALETALEKVATLEKTIDRLRAQR
ncbi:hypothetical protein FB451DRAFT_1185442 [Mycena latifolia]|nr:hypothetical protein FB451DRAFT_1185442 [Mycena latifolia]